MTRLLNAWRNAIRRARVERELDEELRTTVQLMVDDKIKSGVPAEHARRAVRLELGGVEALKDHARDVRAGRMLEAAGKDVRFALRSLRRTPAVTAAALLTLALCTGANVAVFSLVNGVLLRPLPYPHAEQLVRLTETDPRSARQGALEGAVSLPDLQDWRSETRAFAAIAASMTVPQTLTGRGEATELQAAYVTEDFFPVLGAAAAIGRPLAPEDVRLALPRAVISDRLWRARFGADPGVVGGALLLRGQSFTVVGVMPAAFRYPGTDIDVWLPQSILTDRDIGPRTRDRRTFAAIARLRGGVTLPQARQDLNAIVGRQAREYPSSNAQWTTAVVTPLQSAIVGEVDRALMIILGVVVFVLLIGCANLANLLLARTASRSREIAIRMSIGAGRLRVARQFMTESLVLAVLGTALGCALAWAIVPTLLQLTTGLLPRTEEVRVDLRVVAFVVAMACVTAALCGTLPAVRAMWTVPADELRAHGSTARRDRRTRRGLIVGEVAVAVLLVIGAALMIRSLQTLRRVDPGFDPDHVAVMTLQWNLAGVPVTDIGPRLVARREDLLARVSALPGVTDAGTITSLPLEGQCLDFVEFNLADAAPDAPPARVNNCLVSRSYLKAMRVPLRRGEWLPDDLPPAGAPLPFLVSEAAARRFWHGADPVGQRLRFPPGFPVRAAIVVGVVGDVHQVGLASDPPPLVYADQRLAPRLMTTLVVRAAGDPRLLAAPLRQVVHAIDPAQPIRRISTLGDVMAESIARDRVLTIVFGVFGGLALLLAAVGIYGVLAYSVGQRTREIGVRMALGARAADVLQQVVGDGMRLAGIGFVGGVVLSAAMARLLASQLFGISAYDPAAFASAALLLLAVAFLACSVPAWRAARIPPMAALRED